MDYLSDKVSSLTSDALSSIDKLKRKREQEKQKGMQESTQICKRSANINVAHENMALSQGFPFGADSFGPHQPTAPPAIGWRTDFLHKQHQPTEAENQHSNIGARQPTRPTELTASEESLYEGDFWTRLWFQRVMVLSLIRLLLFIRKVYEDFQATKVYNLTGQKGHLLISAATLFLPTIVFTIYRVSRYLQLQLPSIRFNQQALPARNGSKYLQDEGEPSSPLQDSTSQEEAQLRSALISSTLAGGETSQQGQPEEEGLVTARQSPTNIDDYHDTKSQQDQQQANFNIESQTSPAPSTVIVKDSPPVNNKPASGSQISLKESINIDKLGSIPDKETTRIIIGASEQILHGILFIFWQLKRQVDVLGYLVERSCLWRKPKESEKEELGRMRTGSDGLEWFQDFYAAFLAILVQVYTLALHWSADSQFDRKSLRTSTLESASSGLASLSSADSSPDG